MKKEELLKMSKKDVRKEFLKRNKGNLDCWGSNCWGSKCLGCIDCPCCSNCLGCLSCLFCSKCLGCVDCSGCSGCSYCLRCLSCSNCTYCTNQHHKQNMVLDVQLTEEEYLAWKYK